MFVASSRLSILLNGPPFLFHHRPCTLLRLTNHHYLSCPLPPLSAIPHSLIHLSRSNSHFPINSSQQYQSRSTSNTPQENNHVPSDAHLVPPSHPWPEWSELLESISIAGHFDANRNIKDEFVPNESLSMEFVDAACSFLGFAHNRPDFLGWLPKDDIQVLVNNGPPFLFKNATETEKIMRSFLQGEESSEATTFDLMKYILSYASNPIFYPERNIKEATELSARNLLKEMANLNGKKGEALSMQGIEKFNKTGQDEQTPRNLGPNINMKRGDWICQKCSFMNFAKNTKCIECQELRPQRQLTGGEWDCPKCNFFNNGRNIVCLKCECRRPGEVSDDFKVQKTYSKSDSGYAPFVPLPADMFAKKTENIKSEQTSTVSENNSEQSVTKIDNQIKDIAEEEISEKWFKKVAELHDVTDLTSVISDDDFPKIMPMRKGENRFVVSKKKDRSLNSTTYKRQQAIEQEKSNNFVPFVPFPPDYFAKKDNNQESNSTNLSQKSHENSSNAANDIINLVQETRNTQIRKSENVSNETEEKSTNSSYMSRENSSKATNEINLVQETRNTQINRSENRPESSSGDRDNQNLRYGLSLEGSAVKETDPLDMSEEAKAERWFRRVAQIKDISELSQIPDEDFPSIMPMRKGVNRFVVSKRKTPLERRLTSPEYRKNLRTVRSEPSKKEGDGS